MRCSSPDHNNHPAVAFHVCTLQAVISERRVVRRRKMAEHAVDRALSPREQTRTLSVRKNPLGRRHRAGGAGKTALKLALNGPIVLISCPPSAFHKRSTQRIVNPCFSRSFARIAKSDTCRVVETRSPMRSIKWPKNGKKSILGQVREKIPHRQGVRHWHLSSFGLDHNLANC